MFCLDIVNILSMRSFVCLIVTMHNLMLVEIRRVTMFTDKRVLNVLLNGFGVMMVYAGMLGGAMVMVSIGFMVYFSVIEHGY